MVGMEHENRRAAMFVDKDYVDSRSDTATNNKTVCVYVFARSHDELVNRWKDHFQAVLNCPEPTTTLDNT